MGREVAGTNGEGPVTNGASAGTDGSARILWGFRLAIVVLVIAQTSVNAVSYPAAYGTWQPFVWEYSSAVATLLLLWPIDRLVRWAPPEGRWVRFALVHLAGSAAFSLVHTALAVLLRKLAYLSVGETYGGTDLVYEYRKDLVSYALLAVGLWTSRRTASLWRKAHARPAAATADRLYEIRDGARVTRTPVGEILAVSSARNYVEFHLVGGARPLARATLASVEAELKDAGFVRTHRSWLVNGRRVRTLEPAGGGDFRLQLDGGVEAPLSRRFRGAVEDIRRTA